jgi:hypothetical protein
MKARRHPHAAEHGVIEQLLRWMTHMNMGAILAVLMWPLTLRPTLGAASRTGHRHRAVVIVQSLEGDTHEHC